MQAVVNVLLQILYTVLVFGFLIFVHEFGHFFTAKLFKVKVNEFALGMGPAIFKKQKGDTTYAVRAFPIGGFVQMEGEDEASDDPNAFGNKPAWQRFIIVAAGALMNIVFGLIFTAVIVCNAQLKSCTVSQFYDGAKSSEYGLQVGDTILTIDGKKIGTYMDIQTAFSMTYNKDSIDIEVRRDGQKILLENVEFIKTQVQDLTILTRDFDLADESRTFGNLFRHTVRTTFSFITMTYDTLGDLITGKVSVKYVSGPIGASTTIVEAANSGILTLLMLMAMLSANLAVVNILPLPALDGGRLLFILIEMIFRKPVPKKAEAIVHFVGIIILFALMIVIAFKDILMLIL